MLENFSQFDSFNPGLCLRRKPTRQRDRKSGKQKITFLSANNFFRSTGICYFKLYELDRKALPFPLFFPRCAYFTPSCYVYGGMLGHSALLICFVELSFSLFYFPLCAINRKKSWYNHNTGNDIHDNNNANAQHTHKMESGKSASVLLLLYLLCSLLFFIELMWTWD